MTDPIEVATIAVSPKGPSKPNSFVRQVKRWVYGKFINNPTKIVGVNWNDTNSTTISCRSRIQAKQLSDGGTVKLSVGKGSSCFIECVFISKLEGQGTVCLSTQTGCPVKRRFCKTGKAREAAGLCPSEILVQLLCVGKLQRCQSRSEATQVRTVVLMGAGEPLLNYCDKMVALKELVKQGAFAISRRNGGLVTVGIVPMTRRLCCDFFVVLTVTLHSSINNLRSSLVAITWFKIAELLQACKGYATLSRLPLLAFEYCLICDVNDSKVEAHHLSCLVKRMMCKLNAIPLNIPVTARSFSAPGYRGVSKFCGALVGRGISCNFRKIRGSDISASCGQLTRKY